jgi:sugar lactone lactonase YvrE
MIRTICNKIFHLAECPLWHPDENRLYWTDILNGEIWRFDENTGTCELFWKGNKLVGGFAFATDGSLILCSNEGVFRLPGKKQEKAFETPERIYKITFQKNERFNDITTDIAGRILAGTKTTDLKNGKLWRIENGKKPAVVLEGIGISNGMTFSRDQQYLYHTDSKACTITRYTYDLNRGDISEPDIFYQGDPSSGYPDGITMDAEGNITNEIKIPAIQVSSLNFGGANMQTIFITTACEGGADLENGLDEYGNFLGGLVYAVPFNTRGREEWYYRIR